MWGKYRKKICRVHYCNEKRLIFFVNFYIIYLLGCKYQAVMQRWLSGLRRTIGNRVYPKGTGGSNPLLCAITRPLIYVNGRVIFCVSLDN